MDLLLLAWMWHQQVLTLRVEVVFPEELERAAAAAGAQSLLCKRERLDAAFLEVDDVNPVAVRPCYEGERLWVEAC